MFRPFAKVSHQVLFAQFRSRQQDVRAVVQLFASEHLAVRLEVFRRDDADAVLNQNCA